MILITSIIKNFVVGFDSMRWFVDNESRTSIVFCLRLLDSVSGRGSPPEAIAAMRRRGSPRPVGKVSTAWDLAFPFSDS
jgi:hypothetical protein